MPLIFAAFSLPAFAIFADDAITLFAISPLFSPLIIFAFAIIFDAITLMLFDIFASASILSFHVDSCWVSRQPPAALAITLISRRWLKAFDAFEGCRRRFQLFRLPITLSPHFLRCSFQLRLRFHLFLRPPLRWWLRRAISLFSPFSTFSLWWCHISRQITPQLSSSHAYFGLPAFRYYFFHHGAPAATLTPIFSAGHFRCRADFHGSCRRWYFHFRWLFRCRWRLIERFSPSFAISCHYDTPLPFSIFSCWCCRQIFSAPVGWCQLITLLDIDALIRDTPLILAIDTPLSFLSRHVYFFFSWCHNTDPFRQRLISAFDELLMPLAFRWLRAMPYFRYCWYAFAISLRCYIDAASYYARLRQLPAMPTADFRWIFSRRRHFRRH